ncbi:MAG: signal peptide peptidase SppA [Paludibacter sp.]|nr:signal peptide peptidase SppA [Paludibacter sp.]MDD4199127.1 signal peptide peptidase SppA [Paludibacter sp.]MDD4427644.1 signal peptide peptidase SppA [Paludibacter sp.]
MKQFLKFTLATIVGVIIVGILSTILMFGIIGAIGASGNKPVKLEPNVVYQLELSGQLVDRSQDDPFSDVFAESFGQPVANVLGLDDILSNIEKAKNDSNVVGIYLKGGVLSGGFASIKEIRDALVDFKTSGKFIVAYADTYAQSNYYLASVADKVLLNPYGMLELKGISAELLFLKNTFDKLGIDMQVVRVGTYKSAVEPYINTKMSDANRHQVNAYISSIWNTMLNGIAESRNIPVNQLNNYADEMMLFQSPKKYTAYGLVDSLVYVDEVDSILKEYQKEYKVVKHKSMNKVPNPNKFKKDKIAVIYAIGGIDGGSTDGIISEKLVETIDKAAKAKEIKAVVLRVSSPGGSAYGSEQIWRALSNLKKNKPLIISMGDYAASGGYYISCMGDSIVAQPNTITGSIGIFGIIPNIEGLNKKLGLSYDGVKTNKMSDALSVNRPFRPEEKVLMQNYVNNGYDLFVKRCAEGRNKTVDEIKAIAEGRVWTGEDALKIGLVDALGGLDDAIVLAAKKAQLTEYQIREYPEKEDFATKLMKKLTDDVDTKIIKSCLGEHYTIFHHLKQLENMHGIQARMPYDIIFR